METGSETGSETYEVSADAAWQHPCVSAPVVGYILRLAYQDANRF